MASKDQDQTSLQPVTEDATVSSRMLSHRACRAVRMTATDLDHPEKASTRWLGSNCVCDQML